MAKLQFPWESLKAECLRLVCTQLVQASEEGGSYQGAFRKDDMIEFLRDVEGRGLEPAVKSIGQTQTLPKPVSSHAQTSPKRKSSRLDDGIRVETEGPNYNTRFKGSKRVKLTKEDKEPTSVSHPLTPRKAGRPKRGNTVNGEDTLSARKSGRPRKSTGHLSASSSSAKRARGQSRKSGALEERDGLISAKKGRGRPKKNTITVNDNDGNGEVGSHEGGERSRDDSKEKRKRSRGRNVADGAPALQAPVSQGKQVFAGVILESRKTLLIHANNVNPDMDVGDEGEFDDAAQGGPERTIEEEENAVAAAIELNGFLGGETASAPDSSNKENDPNDMVFFNLNETNVHVDVDADAEGDDDVAP